MFNQLQDSIKRETITGVYRVTHPMETYKFAIEKFKRINPDGEIRFVIDQDDGGLSVAHPRAITVERSTDPNNIAPAWGKGVTTVAAAVSALMEYLEVTSKVRILEDFLGPKLAELEQLSTQDRMKYESPAYQNIYVPFESGDRSVVESVASRFDLKNKYVPVFLLGSDGASTPLEFSLDFLLLLLAGRYDIQNSIEMDAKFLGSGSYGAGSGNTYEEAIVHSLIELIECFVEGTIRTQQRELNTIDRSTIDSALIKDLLREFDEAGIDIDLSDWSCGLGVPAIAVTYWSEKDQRRFYKIGTGTTREEAAQRAMTEFIQCLGPQRAIYNGDELYLLSELRSSSKLRFSDRQISFDSIENIDNINVKEEVKTIIRLLEQIGIKTYLWDLYREDVGITAVQILLLNTEYPAGTRVATDTSGVDFINY